MSRLALLALMACEPGAPAAGVVGSSLLPPCPVGMVAVQGGGAFLGAEQPAHLPAEVPLLWVDVEPFCVSAYPFPGQEGDHYPQDGLAFPDLADWDALLKDYGRRLCHAEELLWASAQGAANLPHALGPERVRLCEQSPVWEGTRPLGSYPRCASAWGLRDLDVYSSWALASERIDAAIGDLKRHPYVVVGGTNRGDTYYAPSNYGYHSHGMKDGAYYDDQLRVCSDPGVWGEPVDWLVFLQAAANLGSFTDALTWHRAHPPGAGVEQAYTEGSVSSWSKP